jgi:AcrR family transcriptional regulator
VADRGYARTTVSALAALAGVSRSRFYECFTDKEACFLAALKGEQQQLLADVRRAVLGDPERAPRLAAETLVAFARCKPATARVVFSEAIAAGPAALDARDDAIDQIARLVEAAYEALDPDTPAPDVSARVLIGGACRLLAARLRDPGQTIDGVEQGLDAWIDGYEQPLCAHRWRELRPAPLSPPCLARGSLRLAGAAEAECASPARDDVAAHVRARIVLAVASLAEERGYAATTIADIALRAGLSPRAFYRSFAGKQEAFAALHEHHFREIMGVTAGAFFAQEDWPARIWAAGQAFTGYLEQHPTLARTSFIESYAGDPVGLARVAELVGAFTLFLQEGYQYRELEAPPTALALDAIATTIFELNYRYTRAGRVRELAMLMPHIAFISLAPFLGPEDTNGFLDVQIGRDRGRVLAEPLAPPA